MPKRSEEWKGKLHATCEQLRAVADAAGLYHAAALNRTGLSTDNFVFQWCAPYFPYPVVERITVQISGGYSVNYYFYSKDRHEFDEFVRLTSAAVSLLPVTEVPRFSSTIDVPNSRRLMNAVHWINAIYHIANQFQVHYLKAYVDFGEAADTSNPDLMLPWEQRNRMPDFDLLPQLLGQSNIKANLAEWSKRHTEAGLELPQVFGMRLLKCLFYSSIAAIDLLVPRRNGLSAVVHQHQPLLKPKGIEQAAKYIWLWLTNLHWPLEDGECRQDPLSQEEIALTLGWKQSRVSKAMKIAFGGQKGYEATLIEAQMPHKGFEFWSDSGRNVEAVVFDDAEKDDNQTRARKYRRRR